MSGGVQEGVPGAVLRVSGGCPRSSSEGLRRCQGGVPGGRREVSGRGPGRSEGGRKEVSREVRRRSEEGVPGGSGGAEKTVLRPLGAGKDLLSLPSVGYPSSTLLDPRSRSALWISSVGSLSRVFSSFLVYLWVYLLVYLWVYLWCTYGCTYGCTSGVPTGVPLGISLLVYLWVYLSWVYPRDGTLRSVPPLLPWVHNEAMTPPSSFPGYTTRR